MARSSRAMTGELAAARSISSHACFPLQFQHGAAKECLRPLSEIRKYRRSFGSESGSCQFEFLVDERTDGLWKRPHSKLARDRFLRKQGRHDLFNLRGRIAFVQKRGEMHRRNRLVGMKPEPSQSRGRAERIEDFLQRDLF